MANQDSTIDRAEIATDLERARVKFHRLLAEAEREDAWDKPTRGTRWTNEQLLFHMVFGYMIVQRLLILVKTFSRLPDQASRVFADLLNAATRPFDVINYYGSCAAALIYNRRRMGAKMDRVIAALATQTRPRTRGCLTTRHAFPDALGPLFQGLHDARRRLPLPRSALRLPQTPTHPHRLTPTEIEPRGTRQQPAGVRDGTGSC